jgi:hypothetical protein
MSTNTLTPPSTQPVSLPTVRVSDIIYTAYRLAGILADPGVIPSPEETTDGFNTLNAMLDDWNSQRFMIFTIIRYLFSFVSNQQSYQIGPGAADWNFPRPPRIEGVSVVLENDPTLPLEQPIAMLSWQNFQRISVKTILSPIPYACYYDQQNPIGNLWFYPVPEGPLNYVALYVWQTIAAIQTVNDKIIFPPAYLRCIEYNLAVELAARFPLRQKMSPITVKIAEQSMRNVKSLNMPTLDMTIDRAALPGRQGIYDWLSDSLRWP